MNERLQPVLQYLARPAWSAVALALVLPLLAWQAGGLVWLLMPPSPHLSMGDAPATRAPVVVDPLRVGKLFGEQAETAPSATGQNQDTTLALRLDGVMLNPDARQSRAFIAERKPQAPVLGYRQGDELPGGARVDSIEERWVMLQRDGRRERLAFDKPGQPAAPPPAQAGAAAAASAISDVATQFSNSPAAALREMGLRRTSQGYIVSMTAPKELMQRYGLQPGDRLISVNGQALGRDINADQQTMLQLQKTGSARVEVQRGEQTITLEQRL